MGFFSIFLTGFALSMDAKVGYMITAATAAIVLTVIYMKYTENIR